MNAQQARLHQRNNEIRDYYRTRFSQGMRNEVILAELTGKYFLSLDTVQKIVWERGHYRPAPALTAASV